MGKEEMEKEGAQNREIEVNKGKIVMEEERKCVIGRQIVKDKR